MKRAYITNGLRKLGLLGVADYLRYGYQQLKFRKANAAFRKEHPEVALPPDYIMYETFQLNYGRYYHASRETAGWVVEQMKSVRPIEHIPILDWGCGPGRIIRHMPAFAGDGCTLYGCDYNTDSIAWCQTHLPGISFHRNGMDASLPYASNFFGAIYGLSVLTHLSEAMHHAWTTELLRILEPGGVLLLTTHGDHFRVKLTKAEQEVYDAGRVVERSYPQEGHRSYAAYQPAPFMHRLFSEATAVHHRVLPYSGTGRLPQDVWVVVK